MAKINKFYYLKGALKGSAALVISEVTFCENNYDTAWQLLCDRYNNKRLLLNHHLKSLFNVESITQESSAAIHSLIDSVHKDLRALKTLSLPTEHWDVLIIHMISNKLDPVTSREWEEERNKLKDFPTLEFFCNFLKNRADLLENLEDKQNDTKPAHSRTLRRHSDITHTRTKTFVANLNPETSRFKCPLCKGSHAIYQCFRFKTLSIESRIQKAKELKLCMNCLRKGHNGQKCILGPCKLCSKNHNSLLHIQDTNADETTGTTATTSEVQSVQNNVTLSTIHQGQVLLSTVLVGVVDSEGKTHKVRALLDNGSTSSFLTEKLHSQLKLPNQKTSISVQGLNKQNSQITKTCDVNIASLTNSGYTKKVSCLIVPQITQFLPTNRINIESFKIPQHIHLADPSFHLPSEVQMLLGADIFWQVLGSNHISLGKNKPTLNETKLGWLVSGYIHNQYSNPKVRSNTNNSFNMKNSCNDSCRNAHSFNIQSSDKTHSYSCESLNTIHKSDENHDQNTVHCHFLNQSDSELQKKLNRYFECESFNDVARVTKSEQECEKIFTQTTTRQPDGRFVVNIPLKQSPDSLGDSQELALARFFALERKFQRDSVFQHKYIEFMNEYIDLGHMSENILYNKEEVSYFLPHHGVLREASLTTKLRTVFDASAVTTSGLSFNDIQLVGPVVQDDLLSILIRFRQHRYVVSSDIEKMYRQININPLQRSLQQVWWRENPAHEIKIYKLHTVTYGTASAPYLATRCLAQLGYDCKNDSVSTPILHDFYMDDLLTGLDDESALLEVCKGIISELNSAHFHLRKWRSNSQDILNQLHDIYESSNDPLLTIKNDKISKTLGVIWDGQNDELLFSSSYIDKHNSRPTKRSILSTIAQIYDPLGLINPCLLQAKILLHELWANDKSWDDEVPTELEMKWKQFLKHLPQLEHIKVPRRVLCDSPVRIELHTFCDASIHAYSACVYLRSISKDGLVNVNLLIGKSRVAPFKKNMTIPRLELCGAVLAARLAKKVKSSLRLKIHSETYWCDSTIVLGWIKMTKSKLKQFVLNRINEITDITEPSSWYHIPTELNPADIGSRGQTAQQLQHNTLWFSGPDFLHLSKIQKPVQPQSVSDDLPETKTHCHLTLNETQQDLITRYSDLSKLQRIFAYVHRFINNCRNPQKRNTSYLQIKELKTSMNTLCKIVQKEMFTEQYQCLQNKRELVSKDQLLNLNPFLDKKNVMRVGGRLSNANYSYDTKHPIILHSKHHITQLIVEYYHKVLMHAGPQLLLSTLRHKFWIIGGRNLARKVTHNCITCCRFSGKTVQPLMGNLPKERLHLEFPFQNTAVDYAGPTMISDRKGRGCRLIKAYICVFVCLAVRAVHIELVTELSTDAFLAALNRFISRRGRPVNLFSDNGRNFVGACNELSKFLRSKSDEISRYAAQIQINFRFSPAYSPHFNGLAEGSVKSIKYHLKRVLGLANLTYEEMTTVLVQIEAILNSRPLTPMSSEPSDLVALTPSHFLMGRTALLTPQVTDLVSKEKIPTLTRYKRMECLKLHFWNRFYKEYLSELQKRNKWRKQDGELRLNQMVLVKDDRLPPTRWLLGRITNLYPGTDGIARVADIHTTTGTLRRAFNRLIPLPLLEQEDVPRPAGCSQTERSKTAAAS